MIWETAHRPENCYKNSGSSKISLIDAWLLLSPFSEKALKKWINIQQDLPITTSKFTDASNQCFFSISRHPSHMITRAHLLRPGSLSLLSRLKDSSITTTTLRSGLSTATGVDLGKVAIVGAGPSAFYVAKYLLKECSPNVQVDLIER